MGGYSNSWMVYGQSLTSQWNGWLVETPWTRRGRICISGWIMSGRFTLRRVSATSVGLDGRVAGWFAGRIIENIWLYMTTLYIYMYIYIHIVMISVIYNHTRMIIMIIVYICVCVCEDAPASIFAAGNQQPDICTWWFHVFCCCL